MVQRSPSFNLPSRSAEIPIRNRNTAERNNEQECEIGPCVLEADLRVYGLRRSC